MVKTSASGLVDSGLSPAVRVVGASASRAVDSGLILSRVKLITLKCGIHSFPA